VVIRSTSSRLIKDNRPLRHIVSFKHDRNKDSLCLERTFACWFHPALPWQDLKVVFPQIRCSREACVGGRQHRAVPVPDVCTRYTCSTHKHLQLPSARVCLCEVRLRTLECQLVWGRQRDVRSSGAVEGF
jgi:hypothetical protein